MKVTRKFILRFLQSEVDYYNQLTMKYAQLMSSAELAQDPITYRNAERAMLQFEHSGQAAQSLIYRLKFAIEEGEQS